MSNASVENVDNPLCVDLDGTLIASDMLWESCFDVARKRPSDLRHLPFWLAKGRAHLKQNLGDLAQVDAALLPFRPDVVEFLKAEKARGRRIILVTATDRRIAQSVADHLGLFDEVIGSGDGVNLKGRHKRALLESRFGVGGYDYIGDSAADLTVWEGAGQILLIRKSRRVARRASALKEPSKVFEVKHGLRPMIKALRPHQWAKNVLIFVAAIANHQGLYSTAWLKAGAAFFSFCLAASAVYIINDLLDLESDRKRRRPFASGSASIPAGIGLVVACLAGSAAFAATLPLGFIGVLAIYLVLTTLYSVSFKRKMMVDVVCLALLYTVRIFAGGQATSIEISPWLMAFSMFFFLSLAFAKRYTELLIANTGEKIPGRGYWTGDMDLIRSFGPSSGYQCVFVFALYLNSPDVRAHYHRPELLWLMTPVMLYWISRVWFLACRGHLDDDPVVFALRDRISLLCGAAMGVIFLIAI